MIRKASRFSFQCWGRPLLWLEKAICPYPGMLLSNDHEGSMPGSPEDSWNLLRKALWKWSEEFLWSSKKLIVHVHRVFLAMLRKAPSLCSARLPWHFSGRLTATSHGARLTATAQGGSLSLLRKAHCHFSGRHLSRAKEYSLLVTGRLLAIGWEGSLAVFRMLLTIALWGFLPVLRMAPCPLTKEYYSSVSKRLLQISRNIPRQCFNRLALESGTKCCKKKKQIQKISWNFSSNPCLKSNGHCNINVNNDVL
jgi:hypothetical protein